ncbi:tyrosine-type recombinase/integrase [Hymenobacter lucidus]|uniref:Site-specific integrase n=1 Tax=Hymenobacter lucidus TaxID=2880930 RepID=A0ABS8AY95_9BACT|nr:site-specific integrase [Hymenobacter lucidus]MCB2410757.1 site-specific integrase [Hymenobacter lucidus]
MSHLNIIQMEFAKIISLLGDYPSASNWLMTKSACGCADNTVMSYTYVLLDYFKYCVQHQIDHHLATSEEILNYFVSLKERSLLDASRKHRLAVLRLYYSFLKEENICATTPIKASLSFRGKLTRAWVPDAEQWDKVIDVLYEEPLRNRLMLSLAYDCALRRGELCALLISDVGIGSAGDIVSIRHETTKTRRARRVRFSEGTKRLLIQYLAARSTRPVRPDTALFVSESKRNRGQHISIWTWTSVMKDIASRTKLPRLTTHTIRHLSITNKAEDGWALHEISHFAGHANLSSTLRYIHPRRDDVRDSIGKALIRIAAADHSSHEGA